MIRFTEANALRTKASWHEDEEINRKHGRLLALDALATRQKLITEAVAVRLGRSPTGGEMHDHLNERTEDDVTYWVCWDDQAIAIRTQPHTYTKGHHYHMVWHWMNLDADKN